MARTKLHVTWSQDGLWMLSAENPEGDLQLILCDFERVEHVIEDARELVADGTFPEAIILIDPLPTRVVTLASPEAAEVMETLGADRLPQPQPRRVEL